MDEDTSHSANKEMDWTFVMKLCYGVLIKKKHSRLVKPAQKPCAFVCM